MSYQIVRLIDFDDPRTVEAVEVLRASFAEDEVALNLVGGRLEWQTMVFTMSVKAAIVSGLLYVALDDHQAVVGTACWFPPGTDFLHDENQRVQAGADEMFDTIKRMDPGLYGWYQDVLLPSVSGISNRYLAKSPSEEFKLENWALYNLGVAPEHQGRGIAKMLINVAEEQAFKQGLATCFEATYEKNIKIYTHLGYKLAGREHVTGPPGRPGYHYHVLVKYGGAPRNGSHHH